MTASLTTAEAAVELGCDVSHVRRLISDGRLRARKCGRDWMIERAALRRVQDQPRSEAGKPIGRPRGAKALPAIV